MSRIRILAAALTVVGALVFSGMAAAATTGKISGGTTQITLSQATSNALAANHLAATPLAPATQNGATFSFAIVGGRLNKKLHGFIRHSGGFALSNGTKTVRLRQPTLVSKRNGVALFALVRGAGASKCSAVTGSHRGERGLGKHHGLGRRRHCAQVFRTHKRRIARVTGITVNGGTATGTLKLTQFSAHAINALAGKAIAKAGTPIGTVTVTPTFG